MFVARFNAFFVDDGSSIGSDANLAQWRRANEDNASGHFTVPRDRNEQYTLKRIIEESLQ